MSNKPLETTTEQSRQVTADDINKVSDLLDELEDATRRISGGIDTDLQRISGICDSIRGVTTSGPIELDPITDLADEINEMAKLAADTTGVTRRALMGAIDRVISVIDVICSNVPYGYVVI